MVTTAEKAKRSRGWGWLSGLLQIVCGVLIAVAPHTFAHVCAVMEGETAMACHYTAQASTGIGAAIAVLGLATIVSKSERMRIGLTTGIGVLAILEVTVPTFLIGVCASSQMHCRVAALPTLLVLATLSLLCAGGFGLTEWGRINRQTRIARQAALAQKTAQ